ncbi:transposase, partial [Vibrio parahaemolyticus]
FRAGNREVKRGAHLDAIFPNEAAIVRLVGALMLEQNGEWAVCRHYLSVEPLAALSDDAAVRNAAGAQSAAPNKSVECTDHRP